MTTGIPTFCITNGIRLHYLEYPANGPLLILIHGLTANAHVFNGIIKAGLGKYFHIISVDLRGRGLSDKPPFRYRMKDHAEDILGLLDVLGADKAIFCGHSFGGLLGFYLGAFCHRQVDKLIVLDAAARMNPHAAEMLAFRLSKLHTRYPSLEEYLVDIQTAPYHTFWCESMRAYYEADVRDHEKGGVTPRPQLAQVMQATMGVADIQWRHLMADIHTPVLLVNAPEDYTLGEPLLPPEYAYETVKMLPDARLVTVAGNHHTMLYGQGARQIVAAIASFAGIAAL